MKGVRSLVYLIIVLMGMAVQAVPVGQTAVGDSNSRDQSVTRLNNDYALGRIVGGYRNSDAATIYINDRIIVANLYRMQVGKKDMFEFRWSGVLASDTSVSESYMLTLPEFFLAVKPKDSHRLRFQFLPTNLHFFMGDADEPDGLESPLYCQNRYEWDFLSRGGEIKVHDKDMDNVFYFGPLLNRGQVGISASITHSVGTNSKEKPVFFNACGGLTVGVLNNFQLSFFPGYHYLRKSIDNVEEDIMYDDILEVVGQNFRSIRYGGSTIAYDLHPLTFIYDERYGFEEHHDSLSLEGNAEFRLDNLLCNARYRYLTVNKAKKCHQISAQLSYLTGRSVGESGHAAGNWDDFFTPLLGRNQLLLQLGTDYRIAGRDLPIPHLATIYQMDMKLHGGYTTWTIHNTARFGILPFLTIGE